MKKPKKRKIEHLNYHECAEYIESKLGYDLRDVNGRWKGEGSPKEVEYRDFWHFICDTQEVHNPCYIYINNDLKDRAKDWQCVIIDAFVKEFGEDTEYWVEW